MEVILDKFSKIYFFIKFMILKNLIKDNDDFFIEIHSRQQINHLN